MVDEVYAAECQPLQNRTPILDPVPGAGVHVLVLAVSAATRGRRGHISRDPATENALREPQLDHPGGLA